MAELDAEGSDTPAVDAGPELTEDALLGGRVRLLQPRRGYRAGLDAALVAAAVHARPGERALDAGCGPGAALLQAAVRSSGAEFAGVERDPQAAELARRNVALNDLESRVQIVKGDIAERIVELEGRRFDHAFSNPPFFDDPSVLRGPAPERRGAWLADAGLVAWTRFLLGAVRDGGSVTVIHRADRLADLLAHLGEGGGSFRIRPVHPFPDAAAKRVLVRALKGGRAPLVLLPGLVVHTREEPRHTPQTEAILRGGAAMSWD